jgi:hypothetical protein
MVVGFTIAYAISAYHHWCCEFEFRSGGDVQHYVIKFVGDLRDVGAPFIKYRYTIEMWNKNLTKINCSEIWIFINYFLNIYSPLSVQHYVIKFVGDLRDVGGLFSPGPPVSSTDKTDRHDITEILLKVVLNQTSKHLRAYPS